MKTENSIIAIIVEPNKKPRISSIADSIPSFNEILEGGIQGLSAMEFSQQLPYSIYCNENSKYKKLPYNRRIGNIIVYGTFIIIGQDNYGRHQNLKEEQITFFMSRFKEIERRD